MPRFLIFARKELLQQRRDWHAMGLLFVMPCLFIVIMSLALQSGFEAHRRVQLEFFLFDQANTPGSRAFLERFEKTGAYVRRSGPSDLEQARRQVKADNARFLLIIDRDFDEKIANGKPAARLELAPGTETPMAMLVEAHLRQHLGGVYVSRIMGPIGETDLPDLLEVTSLYEISDRQTIPSSVQQNVPAWLLFAMFFVAIPLSTTLIGERANGTLDRLRTMGFTRRQLWLGKLTPFLLINILQVILMLLVGMYLMPLLGAEGLSLGNSLAGLSLLSISASFAAVSYGLLIAHLASTTEQATIFSGACNIIMAAIGGVMVPRFLMPEAMQDFGWLSPMTWGLEGFLDILLRNGGVAEVLPECFGLLIFAAIMMTLAITVTPRWSR